MSRGLTPSQTIGPFLAIGLPWPDGPEVVDPATPGAITQLPKISISSANRTKPISAPIGSPAALADPCSDVGVVFARGTHQEPGLGNMGQSFVDSLTSQLGGRSVNVYAVNYPANDDYHNSATAGATDANL